MPKKWILSKEKCDKAEIPEENRVYKTKPELSLEMIDEDIAWGVEFDWIGGDGLYGHNFELTKGLDERGKLFVLDVHKDEYVYLEEPRIYTPEDSGGKGRKPKKLIGEGESIRIDHYMKGLNRIDWHKAKVRKTAKGWLKVKVHVVDVWVWDGEEKKARSRTLIITQTKEKGLR